MLGCAETIRKNVGFHDISLFHLFQDFGVSRGALGPHFGGFGDTWVTTLVILEGPGEVLKFQWIVPSPGAPQAEGTRSGDGKVMVRGPYPNKSQIANLLLTTESQQDWIPETCRLKDRLTGDC